MFVYQLSSCKFKSCWSQKKTPKNKKYKNKWYYFLQSFSKFLQILFFQKFLALAEPFQCYFFLKLFIFSNANIINLSIKLLQTWITPDLIMYCNIILNESVKDKKHFLQYIFLTLLFAIKYYLFDKKNVMHLLKWH